MIYMDMDGVVADFDKRLCELCGIERWGSNNNDEEQWAAIAKDEGFFEKLEPMPYAFKLMSRAQNYDRVTFLTAIPKPKRDMPYAEVQKRHWGERHFPNIPMITCYSEEKQAYAKAERVSVLVDDTGRNVGQFLKAGGMAILHHDVEQTLRALEEIYC